MHLPGIQITRGTGRLALPALLTVALLSGPVPQAQADVCAGKTGSPVRATSFIGFKVGKKGRHLKGSLLLIKKAGKGSRPRVRGACVR